MVKLSSLVWFFTIGFVIIILIVNFDKAISLYVHPDHIHKGLQYIKIHTLQLSSVCPAYRFLNWLAELVLITAVKSSSQLLLLLKKRLTSGDSLCVAFVTYIMTSCHRYCRRWKKACTIQIIVHGCESIDTKVANHLYVFDAKAMADLGRLVQTIWDLFCKSGHRFWDFSFIIDIGRYSILLWLV